jgi:hypothetical protein
VLEQLDLYGGILPTLREEFAKLRLPGVPDAPTHASLVEKAGGAKDSTVYVAGDDATGTSDRDLGDPEVAKVLEGEL